MISRSLHDVSELLNVLVRRPGEPGDLTSVLQHIVQTARKYFNADTCNIFASNPITGHFIEPKTVTNPITGAFIEPYTVAGKLLKYRKESPGKPSPGGLTEKVLKQGILLVNDVETAPEYQSTFTRLEEIRSFVGLALRTRYTQKPLAVVYLNFREAHKFTSDDYELYQIFVSQASFMLQETWLLLRYQEVTRIGKEINQELGTVTTLFEKLQKYIGNILDTSHTLLLGVYQPQIRTLDLYLEEEGRFIFYENSPLEGVSQYVIETMQMSFIEQLSKERLPIQPFHIEGTGTEEALIFVPLVLRNMSLGVLSIQHPQPNYYNQEDLFILNLLANHISLALYNIRLYSSLDQLINSGQALTQLLESEKVMDATADKILEVTQADLVVLYSCEPSAQHLVLSPRVSGTLLNSTIESLSADSPDDLPKLMLRQLKPIFAKNSADIYAELDSDIEIRQGGFGQREKLRSMAAMPLRVGDDSVGVLFINFRQPQCFDDPQKLFIEGLAHYAAIAIKNARQYDTLLQRRVRELEILQNIDRELTRNLDLNSVLNTLLRLAHEHIPADACSIMLPNPRTQILEIPAALGCDADARQATIVSLQETKGITRWVLEQKQPARVDNVHDLPWRDIYLPVTVDIVSELDVPLLDGQEVVGILNFESTKERAFRQEDQDFLLTLAGQGVLAIKNAQAYERERRLVAEAQALNQISKEITSQLESSRIFELITEKALELTHATTGGLLLYSAERNDLWMVAERGVDAYKGIHMSLDQGIIGYVARHKQKVNADLLSQPYWKKYYVEFAPGTCSELTVPMLEGNELRGVLNVESTTPNWFDEGDERLLQGLADLAIIPLQNAQAYEREKRLAEEAQILYEREKRLLAEAQVLSEISKEITSQLNLTHVFDLILKKALELTHSTLGALMVYDPDRDDLWMAAEHGADDKKGLRLNKNEGIVGYVASTKQPLNVDPSESRWKEFFVEFTPGTRSELAVPMLAGGELRGVLNVESLFLNNFSESDERLLTGLAALAVVALQNAQAYEREKRLLAEAQVLNEISKEITSQLDYAHVFDLILEKALELTHSNLGNLMLYDPNQNNLWIAAERGVAQDKKNIRQGLDQGIVGYAARHKKVLKVDLTQQPWNEMYLEFFPGARSELAVPMLSGDDLLGVLNVESPYPNNFSESDKRLLTGLAALAVVALQNAQAYEREKRLLAEAQVLNEISKEITSQLDYAHVFDLILEKALELTHSSGGTLELYDRGQNELWMVAERGVSESKKHQRLGSLEEGVVGFVARTKQPVNVDTSHSPWKEIYLDFIPETRSELAVPMLAGAELRGVLNVESSTPNNFSERDLRLLTGLADLAVVALQNSELYEKAERELQHFQLLYQAAQELGKITELTNLDQAYDVTLQIAESHSKSQVVIRSYDADNEELVLVRASHYQDVSPFPRMRLVEGLNGQVARERKTIVIYDTNNPPPGVISLKLSDPATQSLVIIPIKFKDRYYGNFGLSHKEVGYFRGTDIEFFEGLVQELANTIYRLQTTQARQEFEQRALSAEEMSSVGQSAFELTHRLSNDLGLVESYVGDIQLELEALGTTSEIIPRKLNNIVKATRTVLDLSGTLKHELTRSRSIEEEVGGSASIPPSVLFEEVLTMVTLPSSIELCLKIDDDVADVRAIRGLVIDILRNLLANAIEAMPGGGKITLGAHNAARFVVLEVSDTGVGIPEDQQSKVFDLFFSSKGSSGFGLWSARRNALRNHGDLRIKKCQPGEGTTFMLLLPKEEIVL